MSIPNFCKCCLRRVERAGYCDRRACQVSARRAVGALVATKEQAILAHKRGISGGAAAAFKLIAHDRGAARSAGPRWSFRREEIARTGEPRPGSLAALALAVFPHVRDDELGIDEGNPWLNLLTVRVNDPAPGVDYVSLARRIMHEVVPAGVAVAFEVARIPSIKDDDLKSKLSERRLSERDLDRAAGAQLDLVAERFQIPRSLAEPDAVFRERLRFNINMRGLFSPL
jgi:hypothetical protein